MSAKLKVKELREMNETELEGKIIEIKAELAKERALISSGTRSENPSKIKKSRRTIARILTIINEKKNKKQTLGKFDEKNKKEGKEIKKARGEVKKEK